MKSLIDILELSEQEIMELVNTAGDIIDNPAEYAPARSLRPSFSSPPPAPV